VWVADRLILKSSGVFDWAYQYQLSSSLIETHRPLRCLAISGKRGCKIILKMMHDVDSRDLWIASGWHLRPF